MTRFKRKITFVFSINEQDYYLLDENKNELTFIYENDNGKRVRLLK